MALDGVGVRLLPCDSNAEDPTAPTAAGVDEANTAGRSGDRSGELEQYESRLVFKALRGFGGALAYNGCL